MKNDPTKLFKIEVEFYVRAKSSKLAQHKALQPYLENQLIVGVKPISITEFDTDIDTQNDVEPRETKWF